MNCDRASLAAKAKPRVGQISRGHVLTSRFRLVTGLTKPQKVQKNNGAILDFLIRSLESLGKIGSVMVDLFDCVSIKVFLRYRPRLV